MTIAGVIAGLMLMAAAPSLVSPWGEVLSTPVFLALGGILAVRAAALARLITRRAAPFAPLAPAPASGDWPIYTIIAPVYGEAEGVAALARALDALDYPKHRLDIIFATEADDADTDRAARRAASGAAHMRVLTTPPGRPKTKGRACNHALAAARGRHLVIFDAEDRPEPDQLKKAARAFAAGPGDLACLQARLVVDNGAESPLARMMESEYAAHFRAVLPLLSARDWPLPLSGSSNHFKTDMLRALGGWDAWNVTEDADLGLKLARAGRKAALLDARTFEEAPARLAPWTRQRARWMKGFLQTACAHLAAPRGFFEQAGGPGLATMAAVIAGGAAPPLLFWPLGLGPVAAFALGAGPSAYLLWLGAGVSVLGLALAMGFAALGPDSASARTRAMLALMAPFYWVFLCAAALLALKDAFFTPHHWRKTPHGSKARSRPGDAAAK